MSLFDAMPDDAAALERPLPAATEAPPRERLRWEKELLGLYLSDHPLGELAAEMRAVRERRTAATSARRLDQQRVVVGGIVTGLRRVITKAKATMAVATLEDLQGTLEVVVFPKVFEETGPTWQEDAILLVAGRVDHKGEETVLLAETVWTWEDASALGDEAFARRPRPPSAAGAVAARAGDGADPAPRAGMVVARPAARGPPGPGSFGGSANGGPGTFRQPVPAGIAPGLPGSAPGGGIAGGAGHGTDGNGYGRDPNGNGNGYGHDPNGNGNGSTGGAGNGHGRTVRRVIPHVSPLRGGGVIGELVVDMSADSGSAGARGGRTTTGPGAGVGAGRAGMAGVGRGGPTPAATRASAQGRLSAQARPSEQRCPARPSCGP